MRTICFFLLVISSLSLTPLRAWSDEPTPSGAFTKTFREMRQGVFLVGDPKVGTGTAWVVSKKHRLLATNAHVADMFFESQKGQFKAMMNTTNQTWVVEKAYYHPGVRRFPTPDRQLWVRATNHKIGEVNPRGPDLAILQLSMDGPDLPVELHMAPSKTVFDLQTLPAAIMGYPGHDTKWPDPGKKALATFHEGGISRVTDYNLEEGEEKHSQFLQYTMQTAGGYSGSPILLSNGDIVGVHCMSRSFAKNDPRRIAHGVRIDALWELLALHKLTDKVALPLPVDQLVLRRYQQPDPNWELYQKLEKLRQEASFLVYTKEDFQAGIDKCDEAIQLFPRFAKIYRVRSDGWTNWWFKMESGWSSEKKN